MKSCLILYTSIYGQTEKIADYICEEFSEHQWHTDIYNLEDLDFAIDFYKYDKFIFGSSVYSGRLSKHLNNFLKKHHRSIDEKKSHIFIVSLASATFEENDVLSSEEDLHKIINQLPVKFNTRKLFAGALMYTKYNWFIRLVMKIFSKSHGGAIDTTKDHEYTNWNRVNAYAKFLISKQEELTSHRSAK